MSTLQTTILKHPDSASNQVTFAAGGATTVGGDLSVAGNVSSAGEVNFSSGDLSFTDESASAPYPQQIIKWSNDSTTTNGFYISQDTERNARIWHEQGLDIVFGNTNTETARFDSGGNFGIGATAVGSLLHVRGASSTAFDGTSFDSSDYNFLKIENTTDNNSAGIRFQIGSNGEAAITANESSDGACDLVFQNRGGGVRSEKMKLDSSGRLLVGTSTAGPGTAGSTCIVGAALTQSTGLVSVATSGTLDLNLSGTSFVGHLYVSHVYAANAAARTCSIFFVTSRLTNATVITQLNAANGSTGGFTFTITNPSGNILRLTNWGGQPSIASMSFVGTMGG